MIIENKLILEIKTVDYINSTHKAQLLTYLKMTSCKLGLLLNFQSDIFKNGVTRIVNFL
jgi:GxxExxY protein